MATGRINPEKFARQLTSKISGQGGKPKPESSELWLDEPVFIVYNVARPYNSQNMGRSLMIDVSGCPYRCAFCWVHDEALGVKMQGAKPEAEPPLQQLGLRTPSGPQAAEASEQASEKTAFLPRKIARLPDEVRKPMQRDGQISADELFKYVIGNVRARLEKGEVIDTIGFTGGSPTLYRGGLLRFAELLHKARQEDPRLPKMGIYTEGFHIAHDPSYLDPFVPYKDSLRWFVSVKNATPETFSQMTRIDPCHSDNHFKAMRVIMEKLGTPVIPGGLVLDTFATPELLAEQGMKNPLVALHRKLSEIHPDFPRMLSWDKLSLKVHDRAGHERKMRGAGYETTMPPRDVLGQLQEYFERQGTPILSFTPENPSIRD
ncbi:MAG: radical SAM protein, partial [Alphaproteobacteria bacterium]|nr:radical SAM protein [Alphaproteobacteria bacterium]